MYLTVGGEFIALYPLKNEKPTGTFIEASMEKLTGQAVKVKQAERKSLTAFEGKALKAELELTSKDGTKPLKSKASALIVEDRNGKAVCCLSALYDRDLIFDYTPFLRSLTVLSDIQDKRIACGRKGRPVPAGHLRQRSLVQKTRPADYGAWIMEPDTKKEPYSLALCYEKPVRWDSRNPDRAAALLPGLLKIWAA